MENPPTGEPIVRVVEEGVKLSQEHEEDTVHIISKKPKINPFRLVLDKYLVSSEDHFQSMFMSPWSRAVSEEKNFDKKMDYCKQKLKLQREFENFLMKVQLMYKEIK